MEARYRKMKRLFLRQSYLDAWEDYQRSIRKSSFPKWDYIILTSSNEEQAEAFRQQVARRIEQGTVPNMTNYLVFSDPEGKRIGSGGATIQALRHLSENEGLHGNFHNKRILMIHSGGDSKRVPQYSVCGKLFSPVPRQLPDGRSSTLFDEFMIGMAGVPSRFKEGMLVLSGDVLLLFNPLQIDAQFTGAAAISMKAPVEVGVDHGVYLSDGSEYVKYFLHKQSEKQLISMQAVNEQRCVDLDTGAVLLSAELSEVIYGLVLENGKISEEKYHRFVNEKARVSFYGDFLYPLATDAVKEQYFQEAPEGELCGELIKCREEIWDNLSPYNMKLISLSPSEFIHFGTTGELRRLVTEEIEDYEFLDWQKHVFTNVKECKGAVQTSLVEDTVEIEEGAYIEYSQLKGSCHIGKGAVVSRLILENVAIPGQVVCHGVTYQGKGSASDMLSDNAWVIRIYGVEDNPKETLEDGGRYLKGTLRDFMKRNHLSSSDLWDSGEHSLWKANLYPVCASQEEALQQSLILIKMSEGKASAREIEIWKQQERHSLETSYRKANAMADAVWKKQLEEEILVVKFLKRINSGMHYIPALKTFGEKEVSEDIYRLLMKKKETAGFSEKIRILYDVSRSMKYQGKQFDSKSYDRLEQECFATIQQEVGAASFQEETNAGPCKIKKEYVKITLPVRVNWGGGWTDTPPYCNENGGVVLNAAIRLKGQDPIEVELHKLEAPEIQFASTDLGAYGTVESVREIQDCHNPYDSFALHKAALIACGIVPLCKDSDLKEIIRKLGGGFRLSTCVKGVPKGSGLGTSSILAGACVKALGEFLGKEWSNDQIYHTVLNLEQIMSTGGGWQDQVGGLIPGIKLITSKPGMKQEIHVEQVDIPKEARRELIDRFALIYTGQRRLARNLLRDVVGNYIGGKPESIQALADMEVLAIRMKLALERGNIDQFADLMNLHWETSKQLDSGSSNTCIEQIFSVCDDLIDGRFIAGAGGGGFLQAILKKGVTRAMLSARLKEVFQDAGVDVWECEFV